jgi:hypothetical protein
MKTFWERESEIRDPDKRADVPFDRLTVHGVLVESRYGKKRELITMSRAVEELPPPLRNQVIELFCDSKAEACYSVAVRDARHAKAVGAIWGSESAHVVHPHWVMDDFDEPEPAA